MKKFVFELVEQSYDNCSCCEPDSITYYHVVECPEDYKDDGEVFYYELDCKNSVLEYLNLDELPKYCPEPLHESVFKENDVEVEFVFEEEEY